MKNFKWIPTPITQLCPRKILHDVILPEKRAECNQLRSLDCTVDFTANATDNFSPKFAVTSTRNMTRETRVSSKKNLDVQKCCACASKHCCYDRKSNKYIFSRKGLNKRPLEDCADGPMSKCRIVLEETVNVTSSNRGFRTIQHSVATYEQTKKGLSYLYPKGIVEGDGIHTKPLHL